MPQLFKNTASQKLRVFAFADAGHATLDPGEPVTGDAANISARTAVDNGTLGASNDVAPTEVDATNAPGTYEFDPTQAETNGNVIEWYPKSSTAGVQVVTIGGNVQTLLPPNLPSLGIESDGDLTKVNTLDGHTAQTGDNYARLGAPAGASVSADIAAAKTVIDTAAADVANIDGEAMRGTDGAYTGTPPTAADIVNEWESQSQADPTGFHVNVKEVNGTNQTAGDLAANQTTLLDKLLAYVQLMCRSDLGIQTDRLTELLEIVADEGSGAGTFVSGSQTLQGLNTSLGNQSTTLFNLTANLAKVPKSDGTVGWNATALGQILTQVTASIVAHHLDHLFAADYDPASKPGVGTALFNELVESDGGVSRFTANALEQAPGGGGSIGDVSVGSFTADALSQLNAIRANVSRTPARGGKLRLVIGDDYLDSLGTAIPWEIAGAAALPDLTDADVILYVTVNGVTIESTASSVDTATGATRSGTVDISNADWGAITEGEGEYQFKLFVGSGNSQTITPIEGECELKVDMASGS